MERKEARNRVLQYSAAVKYYRLLSQINAEVDDTIEKLQKAAKENGGKIYVRWSKEPIKDTDPNFRSKNWATGDYEPGLSVWDIDLTADTQEELRKNVLSRLMKQNKAGWIHPEGTIINFFAGEEIGKGSDGEPLLRNAKFLGYLDLKKAQNWVNNADNFLRNEQWLDGYFAELEERKADLEKLGIAVKGKTEEEIDKATDAYIDAMLKKYPEKHIDYYSWLESHPKVNEAYAVIGEYKTQRNQIKYELAEILADARRLSEGIDYNKKYAEELANVRAGIEEKFGTSSFSIRNGQATPQETAGYIKDNHLTKTQAVSLGLLNTPENKKAVEVGLYASPDVLDSFRKNDITLDQAWFIARSAKNNQPAQNAGLQKLQKGKGIREACKATRDTAVKNARKPSTTNFSISPNLRDNLQKIHDRHVSKNTVIPLCTAPRVLRALGEDVDEIKAKLYTLRKLYNNHGLNEEQIEEVVRKMDDPLLVFKDGEHSYLFLLDMAAKNNKDVLAPVEAAIGLKKDNGMWMLSAYPLDSLDKIKNKLKEGKLVYSKQTKEALSSSNGAPRLSPDLVRLAVAQGFNENTITEADLVKRDASFSLADMSMHWINEELDEARSERMRAMRRRLETQLKRVNVLSTVWGKPNEKVRETESLEAFFTAVELVNEINRALPGGYRFETRGLLTQAFAMAKVLRRGESLPSQS